MCQLLIHEETYSWGRRSSEWKGALSDPVGAPFLWPRWQPPPSSLQAGSPHIKSSTNSAASPASPPKYHRTPHVDIFSVIFNSRFLVSLGQDHTAPHATFARSQVPTGHDLPKSPPLTPSQRDTPFPSIFPHHAAVQGSLTGRLQRRRWSQALGCKIQLQRSAPWRWLRRLKWGRWRKPFQRCFSCRVHLVNE